MGNQFTPGTWIAKEGQIYPEETGKTLALIPYFDAEDKEMEANAKLISAAPDLLDACQKALSIMEVVQLRGDAKRALEAAIEKAIGKPSPVHPAFEPILNVLQHGI